METETPPLTPIMPAAPQRAGWLGAALVGLAALAAAAYLLTQSTFTVRADGQTRQIQAHAATVQDVLAAAAIPVFPEDALWLGDAQVQLPITGLTTTVDAGALVVVERAALVHLDVDGQSLTVRTRQTDPAQILAERGLLLYPGDEVWADGARSEAGAAWAAAPRQITVRRAQTVTVVDDGSTFTLNTAADTVGAALWQAGLRLYQADQVEPALSAPLTPGLTITLTRARLVTIQADGRAVTARTRAATVGRPPSARR